jgi:hypothetical protein
MHEVFINYRQADTLQETGRLYDALASHFGENYIFRDKYSIEPGAEFRKVSLDTANRCNVMLVMIGEEWLRITDKQGNRRLDDPADLVRLEIETALKRGIAVIPILVENAQMPTKNECQKVSKNFRSVMRHVSETTVSVIM